MVEGSPPAPTETDPRAPWSAPGGRHGALVLHGFTGHPGSMRGVAGALADAGFAVELPLLPGHGTELADLVPTSWLDWSGTAAAAYDELAARVDTMVVVGLSMGATLATWLAQQRGDLAGLVCVNPMVEPSEPLRELVRATLAGGQEVVAGIGSDIADPSGRELSYDAMPLAPLLSLLDAIVDLQPSLAAVTCPLLLFTSATDHVVPPTNSDHLAASVGGPVERVRLDRSYHVATLDYDRAEIEERTVAFARAVTASAAAGVATVDSPG